MTQIRINVNGEFQRTLDLDPIPVIGDNLVLTSGIVGAPARVVVVIGRMHGLKQVGNTLEQAGPLNVMCADVQV